MGRLIAVLTAITLLAGAAPAAAAELTRVASSGLPNNPFDLDLSLRWERNQRRATITRELAQGSSPGDPTYPFATVEELPQLRYVETTNLIVPRVVIGLWEDLHFSAELPYVLSQDVGWRPASGVGFDLPNTIAENGLTPDGTPCAAVPCPIFASTGEQTVYHGGVAGDLKVGLAWAPFAEERDDTKPTWVVGIDFTLPTAKLYDPAKDRNPNYWDSPYAIPANVGPVGQKLWRYDLYTAMSRRMGPIDPYLKAHLTLLQGSSSTFSNCDHAAEMAALNGTSGPQARQDAEALCRDNPGKFDAKLPTQAGLTFGVELLPYEDPAAKEKIAIDVRLSADYTSKARWYNELTDATGRLLATEAYVTLLGRLGVVFRASEYISVQASGSFGWISPHLLTGEDFDTAGWNPNFDWRYDAPGRRFRLTEGSILDLAVAGVLQF